jgi:internalin A
MKSSLKLGILAATTVFLSVHSVEVAASQNKDQSFEQWCIQRNSISKEARKTVDVLLQKVSTQDCVMAAIRLNQLSELKIEDSQISDIRPIASLRNLTKLGLDKNEITDIQPLANLTKLTGLFLSTNRIKEIKSLEKLVCLTEVNLQGNRIDDIKPLTGLTNLKILNLHNNKINDIKPLQNRMALLGLRG